MNSTFSSQNADNMSRKSEFSNWLSFEDPSVQSKLPHHLQAFSGRGFRKIVNSILVPKIGNSYFRSFSRHILYSHYTTPQWSDRFTVWTCWKSFVNAVTNSKISIRALTRLRSTKAA